VEDVLPLSPLQQGMVFHALLDDDATDVYTVQAVLELDGPLDTGRLHAAADALVRRHANLRAAFRTQASGQHVQVVRREAAVPWRVVDAAGDEQFQRLLDDDRAIPFDLAKPPLLRFTVARRDERTHRLVLSSHHLLWDGWSAPILVRELLALYAAHGDATALPRVRPYRDYLAWLARQDKAAAERAWALALDGLDGPTLLASGPGSGGLPRRTSSVLPAETTARLHRVARSLGLTVNTVVQGVWALLAGGLGGRADVVFGATVAGRSPEIPGVEEMVGLFITTVPVRARLDPREPLSDLFARVQSEQASLVEHQHLGLADIQRSAGHGALFDSLVVFESYPMDAGALADAAGPGGPRLTGVSVRDATHYPLTLLVVPGDELVLNFDHDTAVFDAGAVDRISQAFQHVLGQFLDDPALKTGRVDLFAADATTSGRSVDVPVTTLTDLLASQVACTPDATALVFGDTHLTYRELDARAEVLARRLAARGVRPEVTVGVHLERSPELVVSLLAVLKAGGAYVPLDPSYPADRLAYMVSDAAPAVVLTTAFRRTELSDVDTADVLCVDEPSAAEESAVERPRAGNPAYVIYTSGSTGRPKGVAVSHAALVNRLLWMQAEYGLTSDDRVLQKTPSSFDVSVWEFFWPLITGATLVLAKPEGHKDPAYLASLIESELITTVHFVPSMLAEFLRAPEAAWCSGLRRVICSGEALGPEVRDRAREVLAVPLHNLYGPTEAAVDVTYWPCGDEDGPVPIGLPVWNTRTVVLDAFLRPVPDGVAGELYLGGAQLARGYLGKRGLTASRFVADPAGRGRLYRTGDLVRRGEGGVLEYLGRADDQVKIRGFRIEPGEVESAIAGLPGIAAAAVVARAAEQMLIAYVVPESAPVDPASIRAELSHVLPEHLVPALVVVLDALPLSPSGKLDRRALPEPDFAALTTASSVRSPREEILCGLFADVLGLPSVGVHDDFFALGGQSLLATRLVSRVRTALDADIAVRAVFDAPTVHRLAKLLDTGSSRPAAGPRPRPAEIPLSPAQRSLWFLYRLDGPSPVYNLPLAVRMRGTVDVEALRKALLDVVERHESLRTVFTEVDGRPRQVVSPAEATLLISDVSQDGLDARIAEVAAYGFRLDAEAPLRAELLRLGDDEFVLVLLVHHIAGDEWSGRPLVSDLGTAYEARLRGGRPVWRELPLQYADYTLWQRELLGDESAVDSLAATQRRFWLHRLEGIPEEIPLPADRPRRSLPSRHGDSVSWRFPSALSASVKKLARARGVSDLMVTQAAVAVLLHRLGAGEDIPLGTPSAGRADEALEDLVGFFVNSLVLRTDLSGNPSFRDLLTRVRAANLDAYANQDLPFERVVEALNPPRSASRHPLFQVMVSHRESPAELVLPGCDVAPVAVAGTAAKFDLSFVFGFTGGELDCEIVYSTDLFDRSTVEGFAARLERLLAALVAKPERRVGLIDVLSGPEHARIGSWNDTATPMPARTLTGMVEEQAASTPDAPAVEFHDAVLTYGELNARANRLARTLAGLGVGPERTVGVHWERSIEMVVGLLAVEKAGGAFVPLEPSWPELRIAEVCRSADLTAVLSGSRHHDPVQGKGIPVVDVELSTPLATADNENLGVAIEPEGLAYVIYTSGSTGVPKGAMIRHRAITHRLLWQRELLGFGGGDAALFKAPLGFDISINEVFLPLVTGGRLVIAEPGGERDIDYLLGLIERHRVTFTYLPSSILDLLVQLEDFAAKGRSLKHVWCGGEVLTPELFHRFRASSDAVMYHGYGPAEATIGVSHVVYREDAVRSAISIGAANSNTRLQVLDRHLLPVPVNVPGELYAGGVYLGRGYVNDPARTAGHFVADPFGPPGSRLYRTGDLARRRPDGTLEFLGRADNQVKIRGMRVELEEIEAVLEQHDAIRRAVVLVREDQPGAKRLVGYGLAEDAPGLGERVREWLRGRLPEHMVPQSFVFLAAFPLMPSGKVNRRALPEPVAETRAAGRAAATETEKVLCGLMAELLHVPEVGVDDNFFSLGGDSILSIQWVSRARAAGVPISPRQVFTFQTVAALARAVEDTAAENAAAQVSGIGEVPLTPILSWWSETAAPGDRLRQSALLRVPPGGVTRVSGVLQDVLDAHDMLRARFSGGVLDVRPQGSVPAESVLDHVTVSEGDDLRDLVRRHYADAVTRLDAGSAMIRAVWFDLGTGLPGRLLLVVHHLVVDGVSWRILAGDLAGAWTARERGETVALAPVVTSFRGWATGITATAPARRAELPYWRQALDRPRKPLGARALDPERDLAGTAEEFSVSLTSAQTIPLLKDVPAAFRAGINDVLLTALGLALAETTGDTGALVALEGHGREEHLVPGADLSRTVGWFTTVYPVVLDVDGADVGGSLKRVKEQLRAVPDNGIGFGLLRYSDTGAGELAPLPVPAISFNYLGRFDMGAAGGFWVPAEEADALGSGSDPEVPARYSLDVTAVTEDRADGPVLRVTWSWPGGIFTRTGIEALSAAWVRALTGLTEQAQRGGSVGFTPSDVPLVSVNQAQLDKIAARWSKKPKGRKP
jgi:amino acid adenylation domain-containing protein/non-ribosomal peptide synthase protein (TIGR01720 family)